MGILDSIKKFSGSVVSGIGSAFNSIPIGTPSITTAGINTTSGGFSRLFNSAISRVSSLINPPQKVTQQQTAQTPTFVFSGSGSSGGNNQNLLGTNQKLLLVVAAGLVGFLVFNRLK
jgi:hypothetical protein